MTPRWLVDVGRTLDVLAVGGLAAVAPPTRDALLDAAERAAAQGWEGGAARLRALVAALDAGDDVVGSFARWNEALAWQRLTTRLADVAAWKGRAIPRPEAAIAGRRISCSFEVWAIARVRNRVTLRGRDVDTGGEVVVDDAWPVPEPFHAAVPSALFGCGIPLREALGRVWRVDGLPDRRKGRIRFVGPGMTVAASLAGQRPGLLPPGWRFETRQLGWGPIGPLGLEPGASARLESAVARAVAQRGPFDAVAVVAPDRGGERAVAWLDGSDILWPDVDPEGWPAPRGWVGACSIPEPVLDGAKRLAALGGTWPQAATLAAWWAGACGDVALDRERVRRVAAIALLDPGTAGDGAALAQLAGLEGRWF